MNTFSEISASLASLTKRGAVLGVISFAMALCAHAQTFTDRLRQYEDGKGNVTITQSAEIENLVNNAQLSPQTPAPAKQQTQSLQPQTQQQAPANPHQHQQTEAQNQSATAPQEKNTKSETTHPSSVNTPDTETEEPAVDTRKKVMRNSYKTTGYRIQVFSGGNSRADRQKAETAGSVMKSNFPNEPVYVHFYSPSWKCRMGNYRTAEEARHILSQVKKLGYSHACIVKGTISVQH